MAQPSRTPNTHTVNPKTATPGITVPEIKRGDTDEAARRAGFRLLRFDQTRHTPPLSKVELLPVAYRAMYLSRRLDEQLLDLFHKGYAKGTVTLGVGNEATAVGMTLPLTPGKDVVSILHRDIASHLVLGSTPYELVCQYCANADSPTHAREGNVHHGRAHERRFPMISHLGKMLSTVVGATWAARRRGEDVVGLTVIGDGGASTGEFHEAINLATVLRVPVIFVIENNHYAFSTPTRMQYTVKQLSERAQGYGIYGNTIDGTDVWEVYSEVARGVAEMRQDPGPRLVECNTLRLCGHAAYDKGEYVTEQEKQEWSAREPIRATRPQLLEECGYSDQQVTSLEREVDDEVTQAIDKALQVARPKKEIASIQVYAPTPPKRLPAFSQQRVKNGDAVRLALAYLLENHPEACLLGLDIGPYGSAFKTCKGLYDRFGADRVMDMPLCESAIMGFSLGATQTGIRPIIEFQFGDFSTEATTQIGLNIASWYFRAGQPVPLLMRMPCGGGLTMGCFHSGEFEGLWSRFPGLKVLYPATAQETFEALVAGYHDPNPCIVLEHKQLYWSKSGPIEFQGDPSAAWHARQYTEGNDVTVVAFGAMVHECLAAEKSTDAGIEIINPFVMHPIDVDAVIASVKKTGRLLVVQESGRSQGLGDAVISRVVQAAGEWLKKPPQLLASPDMPVPFAPELEFCYRTHATDIQQAIEALL